jgi:hypothetical protein
MSVEPCGSLPVTTVTVTAHYCEHHMAWTTNASIHRDTGVDDLQIVHSRHRTWGPFDYPSDVLNWMHLEAAVVLDLPT